MGYDGPSTLQRRNPYPPEMNFPLHDERFRDKWLVVDYVGQTEANAWGLKDMVGNVSEWTRSSYRPYPYRDDDGRNDEAGRGAEGRPRRLLGRPPRRRRLLRAPRLPALAEGLRRRFPGDYRRGRHFAGLRPGDCETNTRTIIPEEETQ